MRWYRPLARAAVPGHVPFEIAYTTHLLRVYWGVIADVKAKAAENADYQITPEDVKAWIAANGPIPDKAEVDFMMVMLKRLTLTGSTLRIRPVADKAAIAGALRKTVWPLIEAGKVKPQLFQTFPLTDANKAHALLETSAHIGKIVLEI